MAGFPCGCLGCDCNCDVCVNSKAPPRWKVVLSGISAANEDDDLNHGAGVGGYAPETVNPNLYASTDCVDLNGTHILHHAGAYRGTLESPRGKCNPINPHNSYCSWYAPGWTYGGTTGGVKVDERENDLGETVDVYAFLTLYLGEGSSSYRTESCDWDVNLGGPAYQLHVWFQDWCEGGTDYFMCSLEELYSSASFLFYGAAQEYDGEECCDVVDLELTNYCQTSIGSRVGVDTITFGQGFRRLCSGRGGAKATITALSP